MNAYAKYNASKTISTKLAKPVASRNGTYAMHNKQHTDSQLAIATILAGSLKLAA